MKIRALKDSDLKITKLDWADTRGRQRIHVSIRGFSWANKTLWVHPRDQENPDLWARVRRDLRGRLERRLQVFKKFVEL